MAAGRSSVRSLPHVQVIDTVDDAVDLECYLCRLVLCGGALHAISQYTVHPLIAGAVKFVTANVLPYC